MKLNLGCADSHLPGFVNVDLFPPADQLADLRQPWPWADSSVDEVLARDVFEHLPDRVFTMNELWRVLKPGGRATIEVPSASHGAGAFQDPAHRSFWTLNNFQYFERGSFAHKRLAKSYGITAAFRVVDLSERKCPDAREPVWKVQAVLECVK